MEQLTLLNKNLVNEELFNSEKYNEQYQLTNRINTFDTKISSRIKFTVLSLFAGCGGLDLGFKGGFTYLGKKYPKNNFEIIWANEINEQAVKTYKNYFGDHIVCDDIKNIDDIELPQADIVLGGFPCQDFSIAGKRRGLTVERGRLYLQMKRVIDVVKPKAFVAENVKNLMMMKNGIILKTIINDFKQSGYNVYYHLFHAAYYGVPQNRERIIIYGIRNDINVIPKLPLESNDCDEWVTSKMAIDDLWSKLGDSNIPNHTKKDYSKAKFYEGKRTQGNIRIEANKIAPTIRAEHHGNIEGHYRTLGDENDLTSWRRLSVRECARLQTFPDDFIFPCAASYAYKQIGNAVPPVLAWHIAKSLYLSLI